MAAPHQPDAGGIDASAILDALEGPAVVFGSDGTLLLANRHACCLVGQDSTQLEGLSETAWRELLSQSLRPTAGYTSENGLFPESGERWETRNYPRRTFVHRRLPIGADESEPAGAQLWKMIEVTEQARWERAVEQDQERHRRERERLEAHLEQIETYKLELTANVTHDLRTPLASIKASVSGLLAGDVAYDPQTLRETLTLIEQETDRLQRRVQNLLSMSKMESGDALLSRDWVDLTDVAASALESLRSISGDREIRLDFQPDIPLVEADYDQLLIAVRNLMENALLYSPPESPIEVSVSQSLGQVRVRVRDFGQGLMPDEFERIFDKFYRGRSARRIPGTGLGLPICRGIAEAHGGRLWAEHARGGGVAFVLSIPVGSEQPVVEEAPGLEAKSSTA